MLPSIATDSRPDRYLAIHSTDHPQPDKIFSALLEVQILKLLVRLRIRTVGKRSSDDGDTTTNDGDGDTATATSMDQMQADLAAFRTEMREDVAALGDELLALRWHLSEHASTHHPRSCGNPAHAATSRRSAHGSDSVTC
ncbi:hypothetical protein HII36_55140 [Nonomuraea sp. NN258]|nr:hypothetical protein [Nonomuraea antri]